MNKNIKMIKIIKIIKIIKMIKIILIMKNKLMNKIFIIIKIINKNI